MTTQTSLIGSAPGGGFMISKMQLWAGRTMSILASLFLMLDGVMKLLKPPVVVKATLQLGYAESAIVGIGTTLLFCTLLYVVPRTSRVGAILLTGYLGAAVSSNVRAGTSRAGSSPPISGAFPLRRGSRTGDGCPGSWVGIRRAGAAGSG